MNIVPFNQAAPARPTQGLIPATLSEALKFADVMAGAKLVPAALQKSPSDCLMVIQQAVRWQMDPFAVAQECSVIQGKLMYSGKLVAAVVNVRGDLDERLSFAYTADGDYRTITVSGRLRGEDKPRTVTVAIKNARTSNMQWSRQPDQQLMYHGTRVWARRHMPELMLGVFSPEEFDEAVARGNARLEQLPPINPPIEAEGRPPAPVPAPALPPHDPETGEILESPHAIALPEADTQWRRYIQWGGKFIAAIGTATTPGEINAWQRLCAVTLADIKRDAPKIHERIGLNVDAARKKLAEAEVVDDIPPIFDRRKKQPPPPSG